jgi:hypothetical protein
MTRWTFTVAYCVLLFVGTLIIVLRRDPLYPATFLAATRLPAGHLLQPGDLVASAAGARYLDGAIQKGEVVHLDSASRMPPLQPDKDKILVALPVAVSAVATGEGNGGASVYLCPVPSVKGPIPGPVSIKSAICPAGAPECVALVQVPAKDASALAEALAGGRINVSRNQCPK